jgi:hypothetical protein
MGQEVDLVYMLLGHGHDRQKFIPHLGFRIYEAHWSKVLEERPWHNLLSYAPRFHFLR